MPARAWLTTQELQWRVVQVGGVLMGALLLFASVWGAVATWRVAAAFRTGGPVVRWQDGPDLVVMAAPLLAAAACFMWPGRGLERPGRSFVVFVLLTALFGIGLGKGDAAMLDHVASAHGYRYCETLDAWDPHGSRGGGPALRSWGYSRSACPARAPGGRRSVDSGAGGGARSADTNKASTQAGRGGTALKFGEYPKVASLKDVAGFLAHAEASGLHFPCDAVVETGPAAPFAQPVAVCGRTLSNRFCVQPMEGWDGTADGRPSEHTRHRWANFGRSGAKLVWGGEAVAVRHDGRANPRQLLLTEDTMGDIAALRDTLLAAHAEADGDAAPPVVGLQLTHSGRFCRPDPGAMKPVILYRHPILDRKFGLAPDHPVMTDDAIERLIEAFVAAAKLAQRCGYDFIDLKHCHGYLGHEFLSAARRPGRFGGSLENRTRFLREIVAGVRAEAPGLDIGVRLSAIDLVPFRPDPALSTATALGPGIPEPHADPYDDVFGARPDAPAEWDAAPAIAFCTVLEQLGISLLNVTAGSPYYNPHVSRPALYPPSDGYRPPEEPLAGVLRLLHVARVLKQRFPRMTVVGTGYTYLQEFLPHVGQAVLREGWADFVGLGRMVLSYPELPRDVLRDGAVKKKRLCRTFSDCTTAPRNGIISGCYPLDALYKASPEARALAEVKKAARLA